MRFKSCLMFVVLISAELPLPKESPDPRLDHVICLRGIFPFHGLESIYV